jgi:hypothetical protein
MKAFDTTDKKQIIKMVRLSVAALTFVILISKSFFLFFGFFVFLFFFCLQILEKGELQVSEKERNIQQEAQFKDIFN